MRPEWHLVVCGSGPDERRLRRLSARLGIQERVEWRGWLERDAVLKEMRQASVFLFPSLHDEGGWVIVESLANGLPVICLDIGGPPVLGGTAVPIGGLEATVRRLVDALDHHVDLVVQDRVPAIDEASRCLIELVALLEREDNTQGKQS
jgi:glycosyltransferase involved in cell wall biosynthesis